MDELQQAASSIVELDQWLRPTFDQVRRYFITLLGSPGLLPSILRKKPSRRDGLRRLYLLEVYAGGDGLPPANIFNIAARQSRVAAEQLKKTNLSRRDGLRRPLIKKYNSRRGWAPASYSIKIINEAAR